LSAGAGCAAGFAAAKVNLYLHVGALASDGYHPIDSLMAFADIGDDLTLRRAAQTAFSADGPFGQAAPMTDANLAVRAARAVLARSSQPAAAFALHLHKRLPVASGVGGGSADAAAALRLARDAFAPGLDDAALREIGLSLGADVPACVVSRAVIAQGRGERLAAAPRLRPLHAVLVNPGAPTPTGPVFAAFDAGPPPAGPLHPAPPAAFGSARQLAEWLAAKTRNDLQAPALALAPLAGEAIALLEGSPLTLLARMSGSGATAFALCPNAKAAAALADGVRRARPFWWVETCRLA
jgi:4-diphosphocytidyl-2-C-methyl-D-erythritol kinase